jgi:hypothetical protein
MCGWGGEFGKGLGDWIIRKWVKRWVMGKKGREDIGGVGGPDRG